MQQGQHLQLSCIECKHLIPFSLFEIEKPLKCLECGKVYAFNDEILKRQLKKFEKLCLQIVDSEEILSQTSIGITVGEKQVEVPYKLLLTRLNSILRLEVAGQPVQIEFRLEPQRDLLTN